MVQAADISNFASMLPLEYVAAQTRVCFGNSLKMPMPKHISDYSRENIHTSKERMISLGYWPNVTVLKWYEWKVFFKSFVNQFSRFTR